MCPPPPFWMAPSVPFFYGTVGWEGREWNVPFLIKKTPSVCYKFSNNTRGFKKNTFERIILIYVYV